MSLRSEVSCTLRGTLEWSLSLVWVGYRESEVERERGGGGGGGGRESEGERE